MNRKFLRDSGQEVPDLSSKEVALITAVRRMMGKELGTIVEDWLSGTDVGPLAKGIKTFDVLFVRQIADDIGISLPQ